MSLAVSDEQPRENGTEYVANRPGERPQVFVEDGISKKIHLAPKISPDQRVKLTRRIKEYGGTIVTDLMDADIAIVLFENLELVRKRYGASTDQNLRNLFVYDTSYISACISSGRVLRPAIEFKCLGGRRNDDGGIRTKFTEEDRDHLAYYLATCIPYKIDGGRLGNRIYQDLMSMRKLRGYEWVTRHTWQSWREHYKKNQAALDAKIDEKVRLFPPPGSQNGIHRFKRTGEFQVAPAEIVQEVIHYQGDEERQHEDQAHETELSDDNLPDRAVDPSRKRENDDQVVNPVRKRKTTQRRTQLPRRIDLQKTQKGKGKESAGQVPSSTIGAPDFDDDGLFRYDDPFNPPMPPPPSLPARSADPVRSKVRPAPQPAYADASGSTTARLPPTQPSKRITRSMSREPEAGPSNQDASANADMHPRRARHRQKVNQPSFGVVPEEAEESVGETFEMLAVEAAILDTAAASTTPSSQEEVDELESVGHEVDEKQPGEDFSLSDISVDDYFEDKPLELKTRSSNEPPSELAASRRKRPAASKMDNREAMSAPRLLRSTTRSDSTEVFPPPGTRAREHRDKAERAQKVAAYVAPKGTRAAAAATRK